MNISYMLYQAERPRSAAELRESDVRAGEFAAAAGRLARSLRHAITGIKGTGIKGTGIKDPGRESRRPATATTARVVPRPR